MPEKGWERESTYSKTSKNVPSPYPSQAFIQAIALSPVSHPDGLARICSYPTMGLFVNLTPLVRFLSNCFVRVCALDFDCIEPRTPDSYVCKLLAYKLCRLDQEMAIYVTWARWQMRVHGRD